MFIVSVLIYDPLRYHTQPIYKKEVKISEKQAKYAFENHNMLKGSSSNIEPLKNWKTQSYVLLTGALTQSILVAINLNLLLRKRMASFKPNK